MKIEYDATIHKDALGNPIPEGSLVAIASPYGSNFNIGLILHFSPFGAYVRILARGYNRVNITLDQWEEELSSVRDRIQIAITRKWSYRGVSVYADQRWDSGYGMQKRLIKLHPEKVEFTSLPVYSEILELLDLVETSDTNTSITL